MAQSVGPTASATAGATDASGGVGGSDVQLDDAEVWLHRSSRIPARLASVILDRRDMIVCRPHLLTTTPPLH